MSTRTAYSDDNDPASSCILCNGYLEFMGELGSQVWYKCRGCGDISSLTGPTESGDVGYDDQEYGDYDDED